ncbi:amino acid hydroxylase [Gordonia sp. CPCC 205515]|uniref:amino acid hydroxylase n=1 Tax=Gordonia sp. CPCC 205515 TaxID=3140791 RepID=UPI003AF39E37
MAVDRHAQAHRKDVSRAYRRGQSIPMFAYDRDEDALWSSVFGMLSEMHVQFGCARYRTAARRVGLPTSQVPQLREVSRILHSLSGFQLAPAIGTLPSRLFYAPLAEGVLHATPDIRPVVQQSFSPEPDIIHELVGHAVMLADPEFAELYRWFGRATSNAGSAEVTTAIARLFWFTMEVGLVAEKGHPRAYGAAILSSTNEMELYSEAELRNFRVDDVVACDIEDGVCQPILYVADSVDHMMGQVRDFLVDCARR